MNKEIEPTFKVLEARGFVSRAKGLLFTTPEKFGDSCLLFKNCSSVHTFFMRENLDILFCDRNFLVIQTHLNQKPGKILTCGKAYAALERFASDAYWPKEGERFVIDKFS